MSLCDTVHQVYKQKEMRGIMNINQLKILICDDSILVRTKVADYLRSINVHEILQAENGQVAVELYKVHRPDYVFMDIVMPVKSGIEALREILAFDKKAKVIIASSAGTQTHLKTAIESGAIDFIQKPINNEYVYKIITQ